MFDNIGGKIKTLTKILCILSIIGYIIGGIIFLVNEEILLGLIFLLGGPYSAWIGSFFMYGFGQLVENSDIVVEHFERQNEKHENIMKKKKSAAIKAQTEKARVQVKDDNVGEDEFIDITCPHCRETLSFRKKVIVEEKNIECPYCENYFDFK